MDIKVRIPAQLRNLTSGKGEVKAHGSTVKDVIDDLEKQFPGIRKRLLDESGNLRRFVNVFADEEDIRFLKGLDTEVKEVEEISIIPAIAGGRDNVKDICADL